MGLARSGRVSARREAAELVSVRLYLFAYIGDDPATPPVGVLELRDHREHDKWAWVQVLYIRPENRRCAYGSHMLKHAIEYCRSPGTQIGLGTSMGNTPMQVLATKCGMELRSDFWIDFDNEGPVS